MKMEKNPKKQDDRSISEVKQEIERIGNILIAKINIDYQKFCEVEMDF